MATQIVPDSKSKNKKFLKEEDLVFIPHPKDKRFIDIANQFFNHLTVLGLIRISGKMKYWACRCECGNLVAIDGNHLRRGGVKSCGCRRQSHARALAIARTTHGMTRTPEYSIWCSMLYRCADLNDKNYGGRGIKVCTRWHKFENFYADMGKRPGTAYSIDRKNNDGNYEPNNCEWSDWIKQGNNRRTNVFVTLNGERKTVSDWCRHFGWNLLTDRDRALRRLRNGWPAKDVFPD